MTVVAHYWRHYGQYEEEFDTVADAFAFLARGEDSGSLSSEKVVDGDTVYEGAEFNNRLHAAWDALR